MKNVCIINTGGTFNKIYNSLNGLLEVPKNNNAIKTILNQAFSHQNHINIEGIIFKDSLDFDDNDRELLCQTVRNSHEDLIIIIHGTDTMNLSAQFLEKADIKKTVIFVGAMKPFSIEPFEAISNLSLALGFIQNCKQDIYISMQGIILPHNKIEKNKSLGIFNARN